MAEERTNQCHRKMTWRGLPSSRDLLASIQRSRYIRERKWKYFLMYRAPEEWSWEKHWRIKNKFSRWKSIFQMVFNGQERFSRHPVRWRIHVYGRNGWKNGRSNRNALYIAGGSSEPDTWHNKNCRSPQSMRVSHMFHIRERGAVHIHIYVEKKRRIYGPAWTSRFNNLLSFPLHLFWSSSLHRQCLHVRVHKNLPLKNNKLSSIIKTAVRRFFAWKSSPKKNK